MNPIERAHATADKVIAANKSLEASSRPPVPGLHAQIAGLKSGQVIHGQAGGKTFMVGYDSEPSYGDNGKKVPGAVIGRYAVKHERTGVQIFEHGPHAETPMAAKRGANPNAKPLTAARVAAHIISSSTPSAQDVFNDRRFS